MYQVEHKVYYDSLNSVIKKLLNINSVVLNVCNVCEHLVPLDERARNKVPAVSLWYVQVLMVESLSSSPGKRLEREAGNHIPMGGQCPKYSRPGSFDRFLATEEI